MTASLHLVKGGDPLLRDRVLDALVVELCGDDDRSFALEEFTVPGGGGRSRGGDDEIPADDAAADTGKSAEEHELVVAAILNAASARRS